MTPPIDSTHPAPYRLMPPPPPPTQLLTPPRIGEMIRLADDLHWLRFALPFRLNHVNLFVLEGVDGWIIIDCGVDDRPTADHWNALLTGPLKPRPVRRIIITHHHVDHVGYAARLKAITGAEVSMGRAEYARTCHLLDMAGEAFGTRLEAAYRRYGLDEASIAMGRNDRDRFSRFVAPLQGIEPITMLEAGEGITTIAGTWQVRIDRGHSIGQLGFTDHGRGLYIAGDFLLPRISPNISADFEYPEEDRLGAYLAYLDEMRGLDPEMLILPGHDWPFTGGDARAAHLIAHHTRRLDALIEAGRNTPLSVADAMAILFDRVFDAHEIFFASGEGRAHLGHLVATGRMQSHFDGGCEYFRTNQGE